MQHSSFARRSVRSLAAALALLGCAAGANATDTYVATSNQLQIPSLAIGNASYSSVVVTAGTILGIRGGTPAGSMDTYNPANNELTIPAVSVNGTTYNNVLITVGKLVSIGAASWVDSYSLSNGQLRIPAVTVGSVVYNNVVASVGLSDIAGLAGGMPAEAQDAYNLSTGQLKVAAVQVGSAYYTNVALNIGLKNILSLGAASTFEDAPVQGLCYSTSPSATATASPTNLSGQFAYDAGDAVTFWIDGTGGGCTGTTASSPNSIMLGFVLPTGVQTAVLAMSGGLQAADTLTALNIGTGSVMNVAGLSVNGQDAGNLGNFINSDGTQIPSYAGGSIDAFFNGVQSDTVVAAGSTAPAYVTPVASSASTTTSALQNTVTGNLLATAAGLPSQPSSISIPAGGELRFSVSASDYTCPSCFNTSTVYSSASASFVYLDGKGNVTQISSPGKNVITATNLADQTSSGTYSISGNVLTKNLSGTDADTGYTGTTNQVFTINYADAVTEVASGPFKKVYTSGSESGKTYVQGSTTIDSIRMIPASLPMLAGHSVTVANACNGTGPNTFTFVGVGSGPASVTMTQSCESGGGPQLPLTITATTFPGILEATDTSGFIGYVGLFGAGLAPGGGFAIIQEAEGSGCSTCNGGSQQWNLAGPFSSVVAN